MRKLFLAIAIVFQTSSLSAQGGFIQMTDYAALNKSLLAKSNGLNILQADFVEKKTSSLIKDAKTANGKFTYRKDGKIRWEYLSPINTIILMDNQNVRIKEGGKITEKSHNGAMFKKMRSLISQFISGQFVNGKEFLVEYHQNQSQYKLVLKPKNQRLSKYIGKIELYMTKQSLDLAKMLIFSGPKDHTTFDFSNHKTNHSINEAILTEF